MIARRGNVGRIARTSVILTVVSAGLCALTGVGDPVSVLFGGAVSVINLHLIRMVVSRLMSPDATGPRMSSVVTTKFLVLLALLAIALKRLPIDAASFLFGGGTLLVAVLLEALWLGERVDAPEDGAGNA